MFEAQMYKMAKAGALLQPAPVIQLTIDESTKVIKDELATSQAECERLRSESAEVYHEWLCGWGGLPRGVCLSSEKLSEFRAAITEGRVSK